ncbi:MAG: hypothetical protein NTV34_15675 [Proteobacteria bacterium]|nr:hypothetical protein [Pseudomonadota bacterium]
MLLKMQNLRSQGFSYWKIADILNTMKVPTKTQRGRRHARSVQQMLDRLQEAPHGDRPVDTAEMTRKLKRRA